MPWPEVQDCIDKKKHEVRITGATLAKRLEESDSGSSSVPEEFCTDLGPLLTFLELSGTSSLTSLPSSINVMHQLHELLVTNCGLTELPDGIGSLPLLRTLIVEGNQLQALPSTVFNLPKLHTLNVSKNKLTELPDALVRAGELHVLNVGFNQLQELPGCLVKLPKLSSLIASHNSIAQVPLGISKLSLLTDLQMSHCSLTAVPQELADAPKLKVLVLDPNPFIDKKLTKVLKEGRLKNIITHIKKHGSPPSAEQEAAAAAALARLQLAAAAARPYQLLPWDKQSRYEVFVHQEVKGVRPFLVCAVLLGVKFTPELYEKFITLQTSIHQTLCNKREAAAIGTHDISKLQLPLHYEALTPSDIKFVPLSRDKDVAAAAASTGVCQGAEADEAPAAGDTGSSSMFQPGQEISAADLAAYFAGDKTMLRYLSYIQDKPGKASPLMAVLRDSTSAVLSLSPVINADFCRVVNTSDSQDILVEVSGNESLELVQKVASEFIEQFAKAVKAAPAAVAVEGGSSGPQQQQQQVAQVRLLTQGTGHVRLVFPNK